MNFAQIFASTPSHKGEGPGHPFRGNQYTDGTGLEEPKNIYDRPEAVDPMAINRFMDSYTQPRGINHEAWTKLSEGSKQLSKPSIQQFVKTANETYATAVATKDGINAIDAYTRVAGASPDINEAAALETAMEFKEKMTGRQQRIVGQAAWEIRALDAMLKAVPPTEVPLMTFRGVSGKRTILEPFRHMTGTDFLDKAKSLIGQVYSEGNYMSASFSFSNAEDFSHGLIVQITSPKGSKMLIPGQNSNVPREFEAIHPRGTKFRVDKVSTRKGINILHVTAMTGDDTVKKGDVEGHPFRGNQYTDVTSLPEFKEWFGDSKVVDAEGKPLRLFHGTDKDFEEFDNSRGGAKDSGWYGAGHYLTADPELASAYANYDDKSFEGENVIPVYASLQNPYIWPEGKQASMDRAASLKLTEELISQGYDGVVVGNAYYDEGQAPRKFYEVIAFYPEQIKSAVGNRTFNRKDKRITKEDLVAILKANPYHDAMGRFTFADAESDPGWGKFNNGVNFVSIGGKFQRSNDRDRAKYQAEMAKQKAKAEPANHKLLNNLVEYNSSYGQTYDREAWKAAEHLASPATKAIVAQMDSYDLMSQYHQQAANQYTGAGSREMNTVLGAMTGSETSYKHMEYTVGEDSAKYILPNIKAMDDAFASVPGLAAPVEVYRGATLRMVPGFSVEAPGAQWEAAGRRPMDPDEFEAAKAGMIGMVFTDPGFGSTSIRQSMASGFKSNNAYLLRIKVPEGAKVLVPGAKSQHPYEQEVILDRNARYKVVDATYDYPQPGEPKMKILTVELLPATKKEPVPDSIPKPVSTAKPFNPATIAQDAAKVAVGHALEFLKVYETMSATSTPGAYFDSILATHKDTLKQHLKKPKSSGYSDDEWEDLTPTYKAKVLGLKFEEDQHPRGSDGRFVEGSMSDDKGYNPIDRKIIDIKPDRTLQDPKAVFAIAKVIPNSRFVSYSNTPFFDQINAMQGTPNPEDMDVKKYVAAREKLFAAQPVVMVPLDKVVVTQHLVNKERISQLIADPKTGGNRPIRAVRYRKETYILDGHHRVVANMKTKVKEMEANLIDLDKRATKSLKAATMAMSGHSFAHILKYNPYHDEFGKFTSAEDAASQRQTKDSIAKTLASVRKLAPPDHVRQWDEATALIKSSKQSIEEPAIFTPGERTEKDPLGIKTGKYTEERQKLHKEIMDKIMSEMAPFQAGDGETPQMVTLGGRGGSGKSAFTNGKIQEFDASKFYTIDPDKIKEMLPGYNGTNAFLYHEESSHIADQLTATAIYNRVNLIQDVTLKSLGSNEETIKYFLSKGYEVEGHYMHLPAGVAAVRALSRAFSKKNGRFVPPDVILANKENEANFNYLKKYFKKWSFYDNTGKAPKKRDSSHG